MTEEGDYAKSSELLEKAQATKRILLKIALKNSSLSIVILKNIFPEQLQEL